jgi:hypothetical protein
LPKLAIMRQEIAAVRTQLDRIEHMLGKSRES